MSRAHRIHLRGPWQYEWLSTSSPQTLPQSAGRAKLPAKWQSLFGTAAGTVRFHRRFHRPTNLERHDRVFVVFDGVGGSAAVSLNGDQLGSIEKDRNTAEFELTGMLEPSNELVVDLECDHSETPGEHCGLWAPVALEIRPA